MRKVSVFQVADSALSLLTFQRLMEKNARHFSASAYAYRRDLTVHDAILHIGSELRRQNRLYLAEFDFAKYFDSISHQHILKMLGDRRFFVTQRERFIIERFLNTPALHVTNYIGPHMPPASTRGYHRVLPCRYSSRTSLRTHSIGGSSISGWGLQDMRMTRSFGRIAMPK